MTLDEATVELTCTACLALSQHQLSALAHRPHPRCQNCGHEFRPTHRELRRLRNQAEQLDQWTAPTPLRATL